MRKSESSTSIWKFGRCGACALGIATLLVYLLPAAAQTPGFSVQATQFSPDAILPGGTASADITVSSDPGFTGSVSLACQVTPQQTAPATTPACAVSQSVVTPPGGASATITSNGNASTIAYTVTITGTDGSGNTATKTLSLSVIPVTPSFNITVAKAVAPSSVTAGNGAQGTININPVYGYISPSGGVTLSCASITPLVTIPPVCSFNPPAVQITGPTTVTSTLTISTYGPVITGSVAHPRGLYALWLPLPTLAFAGLGAATGGKRSRRAWGLLALFIVSAALLLMPACGNTGVTKSTPNGITPANNYTLTIQGVDANGVISTNTGSTTSSPTVTLSVTAPAQ